MTALVPPSSTIACCAVERLRIVIPVKGCELLPIVLISMQLSSCYNCLYPQFHTFYFGRFKPDDLRVRVGEYSFEHVIILERIYFTKHTAESMCILQYLIQPGLFEEEQYVSKMFLYPLLNFG